MNGDAVELIETLEREFYSFDVPQLAAVIEELLEDRGRIFFEADPDLSFPPSDVGYVRIDDGRLDSAAPAATLRLPVMNLLGAASPLPVAFSDRVTRGGENADVYAGFLSIMQNRLHTLWIEAWRKSELRAASGPLRGASTSLRGASTSLSDPELPLKDPEPPRKDPERSRRVPVLRKIFKFMTGLSIDHISLFDSALPGLWLFSNRARSAQGLKELLYAAFGDIPINIEENAGRYAAVSNAQPLGGAARLGKNAAAGDKVYDRTAKFRLTLGPLDRRTYEAFMPGGGARRTVDEILSAYLNEPVICELTAACRLRDLPRARLGAEQPEGGGGGAIGRTAVLGTTSEDFTVAAYVKTSAHP